MANNSTQPLQAPSGGLLRSCDFLLVQSALGPTYQDPVDALWEAKGEGFECGVAVNAQVFGPLRVRISQSKPAVKAGSVGPRKQSVKL